MRCVHPLVTLIEKLDALHRRYPNEKATPATFVRHYEDAARLIQGSAELPSLEGYVNVRALVDEMLAQKQIAARPSAVDPALTPGDNARWEAVREAHATIETMFWGPRMTLEEATAAIRSWTSRA